MITALSVTVPDKRKGLKRLIDFLRKDKVDVQVNRARGVYLKHVTYTSYSGKINIKKIDRIIGAQRNHLLCSENLKLPKEHGYKRFYSPVFTARLCTNMALYVIRNCSCSEKIKLGIYDPDALSTDFLLLALRNCCDVIVVTNNSQPYFDELNRAMDELGATAVITNQTSELSDRDFIVAPSTIKEKLSLRHDALVLTNGCPQSETGGMIYYKYYLRMPNGFDRIKPIELDEEYFCSALYTLASHYELGSIVPTVCRNYFSSQTVKSLCTYVDRFA